MAVGTWSNPYGAKGGTTTGGDSGFNFFSTPSLLSTAKFATSALTSYFGHKVGKYQAQAQTAERERQYWEQKNNTERQNYRQYEYQLRSWYRDSDYTEKRRQYESQLQQQRAQYKGEVAIAATENLERQLNDIDAQYSEESAKEAMEIEMNKINTDVQMAKKSGAAAGKVGNSVVASRNQFNQQHLMMLGSKQITRKFRIADKLQAVEAQTIQANNAIRDIQDYTPQPVADPIKPLAPLAVRGIKPSKVSGPSGIGLTMNIANAAFDAVDQYKKWQPPSPGEKQE